MRHLPALLLILLCLFLFGPTGYRLLDADQAVHVLMARDFRGLPDLYYWGQDRLGSLLPLLAAPLNALLPPLLAYTAAMLVVLLGWYILLQRTLPHSLTIPTLAFLLFPAFPFLYGVLPGQPYLAQTLFLLMGMNWFQQRENTRRWWSVWVLLGTLGLWASELSLPFFAAATVLYGQALYRAGGRKAIFRALPPAGITGALGILLLLVAKNQAQGVGEYLRVLASPTEIMLNLRAMGVWLADHLLFRVAEAGTSVAFWLTLAAVGTGLVLTPLQGARASLTARALWWSAMGTLVFLPLSHWVALMGTDPRYFIPVVVQGTLAGILTLQTSKAYRRMGWLLALAFLFSLAGYLQVVSAKDTLVEWKPSRQAIAELTQKTNKPALATYWIAYPYAALQPEEIVALPHDKEYVRNIHQLPSLLSSDTLVVIGNHWLETYPDTLVQFNHTLLRAGEPNHSGALHFCAYRWDNR